MEKKRKRKRKTTYKEHLGKLAYPKDLEMIRNKKE